MQVTANPGNTIFSTFEVSDSDPNYSYQVLYDADKALFSCSCPAFQYRSTARCKHIRRAEDDLRSEADTYYFPPELDGDWHDEGLSITPDRISLNTSTHESEPRFFVSLNYGAWKEIDQDTLDWLLADLNDLTVSVRKA